jgi:hypothetical protein
VCAGQVWIQLDGSPKLLFRARPVVVVPEKHSRQGFVGFGQMIVQFQRLQCRGFGLWLRVARWDKNIVDYSVVIGQSLVGQCIIRIGRDGLPEVVQRAVRVILGKSAGEV